MNTESALALFGRALHLVAPEADLDRIDRASPLQDEIDLDSMDFLNIVRAIHDDAGIDIPEHDYKYLTSVDGFVGYLAERL